MMDLSDQALAEAGNDLASYAHGGDQQALERVLAACVEPAFEHARRVLGNEQDASDAVQEALLALVRSARSYDPSRPIRPWLATIVHRSCTHHLRAGRRRSRHEAMAKKPEDGSDATIDVQAVRDAIAELSERDRLAVDLHYFAGLSQSEAASALKVSENAFSVRLHRARERLRSLLERRGILAGVGAAVAVLESSSHAATTAHLSTLSSQAYQSALTLPAPSLLNQGIFFVARHPLLCSVIGGCLTLGGVAWRMLGAETAPQPKQNPPVAQPWWDENARRDLRALDPKASLQAAVDLAAMRSLAQHTKPTSLLFDPEAAALTRRLSGLFTMEEAPIPFPDFDRLVFSVRDQADGSSPDSPELLSRGLLLVRGKPEALSAVTHPLARSARSDRPLVPGFNGATVYDGVWQGSSGDSMIIGEPGLVTWFAAGGDAQRPRAIDLAAPAWLTFDAGPLLAAYAKQSPADSDPARVAPVVGPNWRSFASGRSCPIRIEVNWKNDGWSARTTIGGLGPVPLTAPYALLANDGDWPNVLGRPRSRICSAKLAALVPERTLAHLILGYEPTTELSESQHEVLTPSVRQFAALIAALSGDVVVWLEEAQPFPALTVVVGLRDGESGEKEFGELAKMMNARATPPPAGAVAAANGFLPTGVFRMLRGRDRLIFTTSQDPSPALRQVEAGKAPVHQVDGFVDLGALAPIVAPYVGLAGFKDLPAPAVLQRHLVPWRWSWDDDGKEVVMSEEGLPIASWLLGFICLQASSTLYPSSEIANAGPDSDEVVSILRDLQPEIAMLYGIGEQLGVVKYEQAWGSSKIMLDLAHADADSANTISDWCAQNGIRLETLAPMFGGRTPSAEEVDRTGRWWPGVYTVSGNLVLSASGVHQNMASLSCGRAMPVWLLPVPNHDGWWYGFVNGVPLVTKVLPEDQAPALPKSTF